MLSLSDTPTATTPTAPRRRRTGEGAAQEFVRVRLEQVGRGSSVAERESALTDVIELLRRLPDSLEKDGAVRLASGLLGLSPGMTSRLAADARAPVEKGLRECTCGGQAPNLFDCLCPQHAHKMLRATRDGAAAQVLYRHYLASTAWKRRSARLRRGACALCQRPAWEVHHRTYARVGDEREGDLIALCGPCHARHHEKPSEVETTPPSQEEPGC